MGHTHPTSQRLRARSTSRTFNISIVSTHCSCVSTKRSCKRRGESFHPASRASGWSSKWRQRGVLGSIFFATGTGLCRLVGYNPMIGLSDYYLCTTTLPSSLLAGLRMQGSVSIAVTFVPRL
ncbi:hypothetical protein M431DRAFT_254455 [Trichoderma harzianum CBS 226.95]|uniref:Uncharacterized protein n=1 Tax=Trichoderma harzianum CBS 226.95 TaxID=983964 RepID=A0A2T4A0A7_TRIHA|nr:hypothetical protein M431DRAFT_254455 [Trichoderma harzianum CBS 226.95]PTB50496.1 hypothetical protein M431DRAFT_254455 [Trichoderma harzianum CBS 226.95]